MIDTVLKEGGSLDGTLHAAGGRSTFLVVRNEADKGMHIWPVGLGGYLDSERVFAFQRFTFVPCDKAPEEGSTSRARTLTSDNREVRRRGGESI
jgi:hypothetical protein